jgi:hypothetical protein
VLPAFLEKGAKNTVIDCDLKVDDPTCPCMIHMLYRRCGGVEIINAVGMSMAKEVAMEDPKKTRADAVEAIAVGLTGEANPTQQGLLAIHLFSSTIRAMEERQEKQRVDQAMAVLTGGKGFEIKNLDDVLKLAQKMGPEVPKGN